MSGNPVVLDIEGVAPPPPCVAYMTGECEHSDSFFLGGGGQIEAVLAKRSGHNDKCKVLLHWQILHF